MGSATHLHHASLGHLAICAGYEFSIYVDYSIVREPESMSPAYAAPEIRPLALDHSAGSASGDSLGPASGCRA